MPEEAHTYNQPPQSPSNEPDKSYPQGAPKDDSVSSPQGSNNDSLPPLRAGSPAPAKPHPESSHSDSFAEFNKSSAASPIPSILVWLTFILTVAATGFFWMSDYSNTKAIAAKEAEKNSIVSQLNSESNKKVETEALNFKNAYQQLSTLITSRVSKVDFLNQLYTHMTKDVKITTISLSADNELAIDGGTATYRQVADLMLGLKGYSKLSDFALKNVGLSTEIGVPSNQIVNFSITAKVDFITGAAAAGTTGSTSESGSTTGETPASSTTGTTTPATTTP